MKVLIHLNHGINKTFLLSLKSYVTTGRVRKILADANKTVTSHLLKHTAAINEISPKNKKKAQGKADFIVSENGYTLERLA